MKLAFNTQQTKESRKASKLSVRTSFLVTSKCTAHSFWQLSQGRRKESFVSPVYTKVDCLLKDEGYGEEQS